METKGRVAQPTEVVYQLLARRLIAWAWLAAGFLSVVSALADTAQANHPAIFLIGGTCVFIGALMLTLPGHRLPRLLMVVQVPVACALIGLSYCFASATGPEYSLAFALVFALVGISQPRWTSVKLIPLLIVAYVTPIVTVFGSTKGNGLSDTLFVIPFCVVLGELLAWMHEWLRSVQRTMAEVEASNDQLFEQAPIGISKLGLDGRFERVNQSYADILGYRIEDLVGQPVRSFTHPDDWEENSWLIGQLLSGAMDRFNYDKRFFHADGRVVWVSLNGSIVRDEAGSPLFMIGQIEDITERRTMREALVHSAMTDSLTGLPNRAMFLDRLTSALEAAENDGDLVALMFLDLDRFKMVNDALGHDAGDRLLRQVARRLRSALRSEDVLARFGGDEFTILCEVGAPGDVMEIVGRLRDSLQLPIVEPDFEQYVTTSIGIAVTNGEPVLPASLMRCADIAMYQAKSTGPGQYAVFQEEADRDAGLSLRTQNELHQAIQNGQLRLHYQPIVDLADLTVSGVEALVRWEHPVRGLLPPSEFVELAEECGLMPAMGDWVLTEACLQAGRWARAQAAMADEHHPLGLSVNVSPKQLNEPGFVDVVARAVTESGFPADQLWLEITEGALLRDPARALSILESLRALGVHLAIDDFGTGYSSLSYLKRLPVEALKIDRSFVDQLESSSEDLAIVEAVSGLGASLGLRVVAEGVERHAQASALAQSGCRYVQGYLYAVPTDPCAIGPFPPREIPGWSQLGAVELHGDRAVAFGPAGRVVPAVAIAEDRSSTQGTH